MESLFAPNDIIQETTNDVLRTLAESEDGMSSFRVALLAPEEFELPEGFILSDSQIDPDKKLYLSDVLEGIKAAKMAIDKAAEFYSERDLKFLYFREIRRPSGG